MKILVYGSDSFNDYATFMRGIVVAIQDNMEYNDGKIDIYTAGPHRINSFTAEFVNRSEDMLRQKKVRARFHRVKKAQVVENFDNYDFDHLISFNTKKDPKFFDLLLDKAEKKKIKSSYYKY